jgi:hypothetical protein
MSHDDHPLHALTPAMVGEYARAACTHLCEIGSMRRRDDLQARARVIHAALATRRRFEALYERSQRLREALDRFKARRARA